MKTVKRKQATSLKEREEIAAKFLRARTEMVCISMRAEKLKSNLSALLESAEALETDIKWILTETRMNKPTK